MVVVPELVHTRIGRPCAFQVPASLRFRLACVIVAISVLGAYSWQQLPPTRPRAFQRPQTSLQSTATVVETDTATFTSPIMKVYIEDTDSYGVINNANYLKVYERALGTVLHEPSDWTIVHVTSHKFKLSPPLGGHFVVKGVQQESSSEGDEELWDLTMQCPDSDVVYNTATVTVGSTGCVIDHTEDVRVNGDVPSTAPSVQYETLYRDELDPFHPNLLPLRTVLNICERSRSNTIGGPAALRKLQEEENILTVVTGVHDCFSFHHSTKPGQSVRVETSARRKGRLMCDFYHVLYDEQGEVMAKAVVTLMTLNARTKRPTADIPEGLWEGKYA